MKGSSRFITDNNNYIIDLKMEEVLDPVELDTKLKRFPGVVVTGLFYGVADTVIAGIGNKIKIFNKKKRVQNQ
jgi:ribose 5-phosphate isomerase A